MRQVLDRNLHLFLGDHALERERQSVRKRGRDQHQYTRHMPHKEYTT